MNVIHKESENSGTFKNSLFFSKAHLQKLRSNMNVKEITKGTFLFREGDPATKFYFLEQGAVKLTKSAREGRELFIHCFRSGDLFGETEGLRMKTNSFHAQCIEHTVVGIINQEDLQLLLRDNGEFAAEFIRWMGWIQRFTQMKIRDLLFFGKTGALASTLVRLVNTFGIDEGAYIRFSVHFTNSELANMIGATRETVNRMLHDLKKQNIIGYQGTEITVYNIEALREMCQCERCPIEVCRL